ncbi:unnamed protein product [Gordionus sp. m RMFG-2023]|uniref:programmed cell death 6-interacting protein-like n=1 Tax=Gordionus sp. m RMFG-2023 TaxID=3053472 RepID=UPI0030E305B1
MASTFLAVPLKKTKEVDVTNSLKNFISSNISTIDNPEDCTHEIGEFNKLRNNAVCRNLDKNEGSLEILYRYYDQLDVMDTKMPFDETHVPQAFKWKSAFESSSLFNFKSSLTMVNGQFEKACVLFNIGAMQSQVACSQNLDQDNNLKTAVKYFQISSGTFNYLKDQYISNGKVQNESLTPDLSIECLSGLSALMLAQGQEIFLKKAKDDNKKPLILAKLAQQCADLYSEALKFMNSPNLKGFWEKDWIPTVTCKQSFLTALAQYFMMQEAKNEKKFGEELSRISYALDSLKQAQKQAPTSQYMNSILEKFYSDPDLLRAMEVAHQKSLKENDFIYHERILRPGELAPIQKAVIAKPIEPTFPLSGKTEFRDLFQKIVPIPVNQALVVYETRKSDLVNTNISKLRQATQNLNGFLVALNLPASLEDIVAPDLPGRAGSKAAKEFKKIPKSLLTKSNAIKKLGGMSACTLTMDNLPQLLSRNKEILIEAIRILDEEKASDIQLKTQFGARWVRTPSEKLQAPLREESRKYNQIIEAAIQADEIVKSKFEQHRNIMELLCGPETELAKSIPSSIGALSSDLPVIKELKELMEKVETIKAERQTIEFEFQHKTSDAQNSSDIINQKFMKVYSTQGKINEKDISDDILRKTFGELEQQALSSIRSQDDLMELIQVANMIFVQEKSKDPSFDAKRRDKFLQELASAYDTFMEICANLKEGSKFYNDLTPILLKFQNKCSDLCFARKTERDELIKDMQDNIVSQPAHSYVSPYGTDSGTNINIPKGPPRPPPPAFTGNPNPIQTSQAPNFYSGNFQPIQPQQANQLNMMPLMPSAYNPYMNYYQQQTYPVNYPYAPNPILPYPAMQTNFPSAPPSNQFPPLQQQHQQQPNQHNY